MENTRLHLTIVCIIGVYDTLQVLKEESDTLQESLSQFSQWVQYKLASVEEEMDICKVIYSLHGSLSKVYTICLYIPSSHPLYRIHKQLKK